MQFWTSRRLLFLTLAGFLLIVLWDATALDLPLAKLFGDGNGFPLRKSHAFALVFHEVPRALSSALVLSLLVGIFKPWGFLKSLLREQRIQLVVSILGAMLFITLLKHFNATSCPWDTAEFGGSASYVSHWLVGVFDHGPGHCFPAGHASSALGFLAGWFVIRRAAPSRSTRWLILSLLVGLALGVTQQMRGAHYMSHTLWTAWVCWAFGWIVDLVVSKAHALRVERGLVS